MAKKATTRAAPAKAGGHKTRVFTLKAPGAASVLLVGDFTRWQRKPIPLQLQGSGLWQAEVELASGDHHYRFLVDGEWRNDPTCAVHVPNAFGSQDCVCQVG